MESRSHALAAGLFVVLFAFAALMSLWWFSGSSRSQREVLVVAQHHVNGLGGQGTVRYRGVRVGKIDDVRFDPAGSGEIHVRILVDASAPIHEKTVAKLAFQGVTGQAHLQLEDAPAAKPLPQSGALLRIALQPSLLSDSIDTGVETLKQVREITTRINTLLAATDPKQMARTLDHVERFAGHAADASGQLPEVITRLKKMASDENLQRLSNSLKNAEAAAGRAPGLMDETKALTVSLRTVADRIDATLAKVEKQDFSALAAAPGKVNDLASQVTQTVGHLDRLIRQLEDAPNSLVFGRSVREPGPGEAGFGERK